jgi:hypothetical protein
MWPAAMMARTACHGWSSAAQRLYSHLLFVQACVRCPQVWLDARGSGLDRDKWRDECLAEVSGRPPRTRLEAHLLIKGFLAKGPSDPYTRFIPQDEFRQLTKFDVSGVGLNVVSGEEYVAKMSQQLPRGKQVGEGGAWVVGLIKVRSRLPVL